MLASVVSTAAPAAAVTELPGASETILSSWDDAHGNTIILRDGTYNGKDGFGWEKIQSKHRIHEIGSVRFVTQNPEGGTPQGGDRVYMAYANRKECDGGYCRYVESLPVRAVVNFDYRSTYYDAKVDGILGVKTTYCLNKDKAPACPSWVDKAFAKPARPGPATLDVGGVIFSYAPLLSTPERR